MSRLSTLLFSMAATIIALVVVFVLHIHYEDELQTVNDTRLQSSRLAEELRQSSNHLMRFVRAYVATGDEAYKRRFEAVRDIRDGRRPRPVDYGAAYWDFVAAPTEERPVHGPAVPLLQLMQRAGFTPSEFAKLAEAKRESDALAAIEQGAMALVERRSPPDPLLQASAIAMLHDEAFHQATVRVMTPISAFEQMVERRTEQAVQQARLLNHIMQLAQVALGLMLAGLSVQLHMERRRRRDLRLRQFQAIVSSSEDAIIAKTLQGVITSWNLGAEKIFGYTAEEAIGQPITLVIPPERLGEEPQILARIARGERVDHFETERLHKDGRRLQISATISPILDRDGRVIGASKIARDITRTKLAEAEVHRLAFYDALTGLPNRRLLQERLNQALLAMRRRPHGCALLFIDLDHFKTLNDTRGHDAGDELLREVGHRLQQCIRSSDTVARFGGDEFVVLLQDGEGDGPQGLRQAEVVGAKILHSLSQPYDLTGGAHHSSPSIGVAMARDADTTPDELLKQADLALYQAKAAGRRTLRFFDPGMQKAVNQRAQLETELRHALAQQQFELHLQPQVCSRGQSRGGELLLRWRKPDGSLAMPQQFVPASEESGLIIEIGRWVLGQTCQLLARWQEDPALRDLSLAVNISPRQLQDPGFANLLLQQFTRTGANPQRLILEFTEGSLARHVDTVLANMNSLRAWGVRFSLDDFGTGYSSLAHLKRMPLHELKIDARFVQGMLTERDDAGIARMVTTLAASLGVNTLAEGVETEAQRRALADLGCHCYQGHLFGRPVPVPEFEAQRRAEAERIPARPAADLPLLGEDDTAISA